MAENSTPFAGFKEGVAAPAVERAVSDSEIGQATGVVVADRNVAGSVDHEIVDAAVPLQCRLGGQVAERGEALASCSRNLIAHGAGQRRGHVREITAPDVEHAHGELSAGHGLGESVSDPIKREIALTFESGDEIRSVLESLSSAGTD